jgi:uncharacterized membrane protein
MYSGLLHSHSYLRYAVLILLIVVIAVSLMGWLGKKPYTNTNNKLSLFLLIATHLQFLLGLFLYFVSPFVQFNSTTMKDTTSRYWAVEHASMMIIAVVLITVARSTAKKMTSDESKHKRLFIFNSIALIIILTAITMSGRGII